MFTHRQALLGGWFVLYLCSLVFVGSARVCCDSFLNTDLLPPNHLSSDQACVGFETPGCCLLLDDLNCSCLGRKMVIVALPS